MAINLWQGPGSSTTTSNWGTGTNWSTGSACVSTDTAILTNSNVDINAGLSVSAVVLNEFRTYMDYAANVGTITDYLNVGGSLFNIGFPSINVVGNGSRRMNINAATSSAVFNIYGTGSTAADPAMTPVRLLGTSLVVNCFGGISGAALLESETASIATLNILQNATMIYGDGVTATTSKVYAGNLNSYSKNTHTAVTVDGNGVFNKYGVGAITALTIGSNAKSTYFSGTVATLNLTGTIDFGGATVTLTNTNLYRGARLLNGENVTFTNPFALINCGLKDVTIDLGIGRGA